MNLSKLRKKCTSLLSRVLLLHIQISSTNMDQRQTYFVGGRHKPNTIDKNRMREKDF